MTGSACRDRSVVDHDATHARQDCPMSLIRCPPAQAEQNVEKHQRHCPRTRYLGTGCISADQADRRERVRITMQCILIICRRSPGVPRCDPTPTMKRILTWDQGVEMRRHRDLAAATGIDPPTDSVLRCLIAAVAARCHDADMRTTNYEKTQITVSPDAKAASGTAPPTGKASVAELQAGPECVTSW
jgi:hypothetical protein